jgi:purine nucleosidase
MCHVIILAVSEGELDVMLPVILDTDIGTDVDDALALAFATHSQELDILAVTTVGGNARLRARIARKLLDLMGRDDIPVAAGYDNTLDDKPSMMLGHEGRGFIETEQDGLPIAEEHAVDLIIEILKSSEVKSTIVCIGPLTNIADALRREASLIEHIERIILTGGSVTPRDVLKKEGWIKLPAFLKARLEYNMNADPRASDIVMKGSIPLLLVPAEITFRTWLTAHERSQFRQSQEPQGAILNRMCDDWVESFSGMLSRMLISKKVAQVYLHDPLSVATAFTRDFVTIEEMHLVPGRRFGVFRTLRKKNKPANAEVVTDLDVRAWKRLFAKRAFGVTLT